MEDVVISKNRAESRHAADVARQDMRGPDQGMIRGDRKPFKEGRDVSLDGGIQVQKRDGYAQHLHKNEDTEAHLKGQQSGAGTEKGAPYWSCASS